MKEGLQEQLVEKNLPQSGKGAERLSAEDYAERERQLRVSQPARAIPSNHSRQFRRIGSQHAM